MITELITIRDKNNPIVLIIFFLNLEIIIKLILLLKFVTNQ